MSKILLGVGDHKMNGDLLFHLLNHYGYAVTVIRSGRQALHAIETQGFDLVFLDIIMPEMSGYHILKRLKANDALRHIPVIMISSAVEETDCVIKCLEMGAEDYLIEPVNPVLLKARIDACLERKRLRDLEVSYLQQLEAEKQRSENLLKVIIPIGIALSAEKDIDRLLEMILAEAKSICNADGGTLYLRTEDDCLVFAIMHTDSLNIAKGGTTGKDIPHPPLRLYDEATGKPNHHNVATHAVLTRSTINIPDAYHAEGFDFSGTKAFDQQNGYRSASFLTIPLTNHVSEVIGVLQLLNAQDTKTGEIIAFSQAQQQVIEALASLAAVAIDNQLLIQEQKNLLNGVIEMIAKAVDAKSPYTGGHCARVPAIMEMMAEAACAATTGPFKDFNLSEDEFYELQVAALLHDAGKVTTPVHVVDKATKLETIYDRVNTIKTRLALLKRDREIAYLKGLMEKDADPVALKNRFEKQIAQIDDDCAFIESINVGGESMDGDKIKRLKQIAAYRWVDGTGEQNLLDDDEVYNLSITRGTLTPEEREIVNNHVVLTIDMLEKLPFPKHLQRVPEYAGAHHERVDGKGYPRGLTRQQMSIPARMMAIADIFEALTASDRPYKQSKTLGEAMQVMASMKQDGHIDPDLFDLFVESGVYERYARRYLRREQIDAVHPGEFLMT